MLGRHKDDDRPAHFDYEGLRFGQDYKDAAFNQYAVLKTLDRNLADRLYAMIFQEKILGVSRAGFAATLDPGTSGRRAYVSALVSGTV